MTGWEQMERGPGHHAMALSRDPSPIPIDPGVYAFYLDGKRLYVGKATSLAERLRTHLRTTTAMTNSAFRRNCAAHLDIASAADIKAGRYKPSEWDAEHITQFVWTMKVRWIKCPSEPEAHEIGRASCRERV